MLLFSNTFGVEKNSSYKFMDPKYVYKSSLMEDKIPKLIEF